MKIYIPSAVITSHGGDLVNRTLDLSQPYHETSHKTIRFISDAVGADSSIGAGGSVAA